MRAVFSAFRRNNRWFTLFQEQSNCSIFEILHNCMKVEGQSQYWVHIEYGNIKAEAEDMVMGDLKNHFRPEFLNHLDETILFKPLSKEVIDGIIKLIVGD